MKMKIMISGKGGSGKSTVTSLLAKNLVDRGYKVLVIDADESNYGLNSFLGIENKVELIDQLGGYDDVFDRIMKAYTAGSMDFNLVEASWGISDIPKECISQKGEIRLLQVGKVKHFGQGCACPMGCVSRDFLNKLTLAPNEIVIIDTEAGVEHLARGNEKDVDLVLAVLDPSLESLRLSNKITDMANEAGKPTYFVLNKVNTASKERMISALGPDRIVGVISFDDAISQRGLDGEELSMMPLGIRDLTDFLERHSRSS
jgi:CO dehydrogenase maturation factor